MCNLYQPPPEARYDHDPDFRPLPDGRRAWKLTVAPFGDGPFMLADRSLVGQWGMIPPYSKTRRPTLPNGRPLSTNNARRERMASAPTFLDAWKSGRRCLIPALSYDEPYWGTGKNIWWRFWRADDKPWMLAGLWSEWTDHETGEVIPSYTMITQNCDGHPLLKLMHKPDPKLPADQQDKRSVVPIEREHWEAWLLGTSQQAEDLIEVPRLDIFRHGAADPAHQVALPGLPLSDRQAPGSMTGQQ